VITPKNQVDHLRHDCRTTWLRFGVDRQRSAVDRLAKLSTEDWRIKFDADNSGTAILVSVAAFLALLTFTSSDPSTGEILFVVGFAVLALRETGTISFGSERGTEIEADQEPTPATDGGQRRVDE